MKRFLLSALLAAAMCLPSAAADLAPVRVSGPDLVAGGKPIRLRGINWGWWHLSGTRYSEDDMKRQAAWGANVARLAFSYGDLEELDRAGVWREEGFREFDDVVRWAARYGQYVIFDMHVAPGGQSPALYTDGGRNKIWSDSAFQKRYLNLWREIARRYRSRPEVAAYELMNEPATQQPTDAALAELNRRAVAAIREVDPAKVIVVAGDRMSGATSLTDAIKLDDPNILYTFHFYDGANSRWIGNLKDGEGLRGTIPWTKVEQTFTPPAGVSLLRVMLRSSNNTGSAWFDDVVLQDDAGRELVHGGFATGAEGFTAERDPRDRMTADAGEGHAEPGSLKVRGTTSYNGWQSGMVRVEPGKTYRLTGWIKLDGATGDTYLSAAFFNDFIEPKNELRRHLEKAAAFGRKYNVPVWVGEFGCAASVVPATEQTRWVRDCYSLFEEAGFHWTYWNYRETTGPTSMALHAEKKDGSDYPVNDALLAALKEGWALNGKIGR